MAAKFLAAIDHGTTSTRCMLFDGEGRPVVTAQRAQTMHYPRPGWVELDMDEVWQRTQECIHEALGSAGASPADVAGVGIADERESVVSGTGGRDARLPGRSRGRTHVRPPRPTRSRPTEASIGSSTGPACRSRRIRLR